MRYTLRLMKNELCPKYSNSASYPGGGQAFTVAVSKERHAFTNDSVDTVVSTVFPQR